MKQARVVGRANNKFLLSLAMSVRISVIGCLALFMGASWTRLSSVGAFAVC